jgi:CRISPR-associated protein Cas1
MRGDKKQVLPWPSDRIQAIAYAALLSEFFGVPVTEARVRYHADNVTAIIPVNEMALADLKTAIDRARSLQQSTQRPPITLNENLCTRCSLAPVCLPEEERIHKTIESDDVEHVPHEERPPPKLFPSLRQKQTLHICINKARVGRSGESIVVASEDEEKRETKQSIPIQDIDSILIHGYAQISTQAIHLCAFHGVVIQWMTYGGRFAAGTTFSLGRVQQRIRQYTALQDESIRMRLARALVHAKVEMQLKYLLRCTRGPNTNRAAIENEIELIRGCLRGINQVTAASSLLGYEGTAAKAYFASLPAILSSNTPPEMAPKGRSKHPPKDRFNALLSYGYSMLFALVERSALAVGLEPAFGFYHRPRSSAPPLVMDVMELFRTNIWEIPLIGSVNRQQWNPDNDFVVTHNKVWLSDSGRRKAIALFEERLCDTYTHPHTGQSMAYSRMVELELRLLEKEWTGAPGMFAQLRLR